MNRRDFLRHSTLSGTALALPRDASPAPAPAAEWFDRPMRWAQLTLVEDDPGKYDLAFWLDYFRRTHSDAACLSAGGCVAYYPTKVPLHYRSQWLGTGDAFGELVAGCRKLGMVVIARTDPARRAPGCLRRASRLDRGGCRRQEAPPLGHAGNVGHLRAGPLQFRVHDRGDQGDRLALPGGRHLQQPLGRLRHVLLRALPRRIFTRPRGIDLPRTNDPAGPAAAPTSTGASSGCSNSGASGTPRSARSTRPPATSPTPAAARSAIWT